LAEGSLLASELLDVGLETSEDEELAELSATEDELNALEEELIERTDEDLLLTLEEERDETLLTLEADERLLEDALLTVSLLLLASWLDGLLDEGVEVTLDEELLRCV